MLSKKQQKKLKKLEKLRQQEQEQQGVDESQEKELNVQKPSTHQQQKNQLKHSHTKPHQPSQLDNQQQPQLSDNGDIDFNQLEEVDNQHQKIDVTFLIAQIREQYYHSMKTVLLRYGQIVGETQSEVASEVLEKGNLGNVVVAEDDQEGQQQQDEKSNNQSEEENEQNDQLNVYSVLTILPSQVKITAKVVKQALISLQKHKLQLPKSSSKCQQILKTPKSTSLLLSARLPNLPSFIVCDSHEVFVSDLEELKKTQPKHQIFASEYLLNVSEVEISAGSSMKELDELIFAKFEDYEFCRNSLCWWVGENVKSQRQKADLRKLYFVIKLKDYFSAVKNIKTYLEQEQQQN